MFSAKDRIVHWPFLLQRSGETGRSRQRDPCPALLAAAVLDLIGA